MKPYLQERFRVFSRTIVSALVGAALSAASVVDASPSYSGTITGIFSAPVLIGFNINPDGTINPLDNSAGTAVITGDGTDTFT